MNKIRICNVRGVFANIYQWGEGWSKETSEKWDNFLQNYDGCHWHPVKIHDIWYLVGVEGSIYLHPMDFNAVLRSAGGRSVHGNDDDLEDYFGSYLDELKEICCGLAEACGGQFTSLVAEAQEVENNNLRQLIK